MWVERHRNLRRRGADIPYIDPRLDSGAALLEGSQALDDARAEVGGLLQLARKQMADLDSGSAASLITPSFAGVPHEPFLPDRFLGSIRGPLSGRNLHAAAPENVRDWVLWWGLVGQEVVLTSQLGTGVAECLRRLDDIAYLKRW